MGTGYKVIGQTGSCVLSDEKIQYKLSKKRTVRYWVRKLKSGFLAEVIGPFHSKLYGTCAYGTKRKTAKDALIGRLANDHNYIGTMLLSDTDESDTVGDFDRRLLDENAMARPITNNELVGSAGK